MKWLNLFKRKRQPKRSDKAEPLTAQKIDYAYTIYWTKMARGWERGRQQEMLRRVQTVINAAGFEGNALLRKYAVEGLDDLAHSGSSLLALQKVLQALLADTETT